MHGTIFSDFPGFPGFPELVGTLAGGARQEFLLPFSHCHLLYHPLCIWTANNANNIDPD